MNKSATIWNIYSSLKIVLMHYDYFYILPDLMISIKKNVCVYIYIY